METKLGVKNFENDERKSINRRGRKAERVRKRMESKREERHRIKDWENIGGKIRSIQCGRE